MTMLYRDLFQFFCPSTVKMYSLSKKSVRVTVFWITFVRKKIETCGFRRSTAKVKRHLFTSKLFSGKQSWSRLLGGSLENSVGSLKTYMEAYWFFHIFGISIENWVYSYMFRTFSRRFVFVDNLWPRVTSINKVSQNTISTV
jgi:hypothetical protein